MKRLNVFADEAGNFDFSKKDGASSYFIVCTVTMEDCANPAASLIELRRQLAWEQAKLGDYFHCTNDVQAVRNRVMQAIIRHDFHIQATVMEKAKANPSVRKKDADFYRHGWLYHLRHGLQNFMLDNDEVHITAASLGTKKDKVDFPDGVREVVRGEIEDVDARTSFWPCATDPCLQIADYCTWAIQRKWEKGDVRTYDLVKDRITYEYDLFKRGSMRYY